LKSVPNEPALPPSEGVGRKGRNLEKTTWFEAQDLTVLKAWNNEIQEIQHEISLFGSLKTVDVSIIHPFCYLYAYTFAVAQKQINLPSQLVCGFNCLDRVGFISQRAENSP
jgi:hypothetical protein